jgi:hypothetical protein
MRTARVGGALLQHSSRPAQQRTHTTCYSLRYTYSVTPPSHPVRASRVTAVPQYRFRHFNAVTLVWRRAMRRTIGREERTLLWALSRRCDLFQCTCIRRASERAAFALLVLDRTRRHAYSTTSPARGLNGACLIICSITVAI